MPDELAAPSFAIEAFAARAVFPSDFMSAHTRVNITRIIFDLEPGNALRLSRMRANGSFP